MKKGPVTPKGFRDIDPILAKKRRDAISNIALVLESFGFVPLETPIIEFAETLLGKYGTEEKLIYKFKDRGGRDLALRYDLTVPLARFIANNLGLLNPSFARYQIGEVFRGENPQAGRYRQFTQFDFDVVGSDSIEEDAKVVAAAIKASEKVGLSDSVMLINYVPFLQKEAELDGIKAETKAQVFMEIDKMGKVPQSQINSSIANLGNSYVSTATISGTINSFDEYSQPGTVSKVMADFEGFVAPNNFPPLSPAIIEAQLNEASQQTEREEIFKEPNEFLQLKQILVDKGINESRFKFERTLVRGLSYYTGFIFELKPNAQRSEQSLGGGGRYDNLIGMFAGRPIPAVGFAFGLDRLVNLVE